MMKIIKSIIVMMFLISLSSAATLRNNIVHFYHPEFKHLTMDDIKPQFYNGNYLYATDNYAVTAEQPFDGVKAIDVHDHDLNMDELSINVQAGRHGDDYTAAYALGMLTDKNTELLKKEDIQMTSSLYIKDFLLKVEKHLKPFKYSLFGLFAYNTNTNGSNFAIKPSIHVLGGAKINDLVIAQYGKIGGLTPTNPWALFYMKNGVNTESKNGCIYVRDNNSNKYTICGINHSSNDFIILKGWVTGYKNYEKLKNIKKDF